MSNTPARIAPHTDNPADLSKQIRNQADALVEIVLAHPAMPHEARTAIGRVCMALDAIAKEAGR